MNTHLYRRIAQLALVVLSLCALTGCVNTSTSLTVSRNDEVTGRILIAANTTTFQGTLGQLRAPRGLEEKVTVKDYSANGYSGKELFFIDLTFPEFDSLTQSVTLDQARPYEMQFRRVGSTVEFAGSLDLSQLPADSQDSYATVEISFPGVVSSTNGQIGRDNTVSWTPTAGKLTTMVAVSEFSDPAARGFAIWLIVGVGIALLVSVAVAFSARSSRISL